MEKEAEIRMVKLKKIGKMNKIIIFIFSIILSISGVYAQKTSFSAQAPKMVAVGESFRVTYTLNAKGSNLKVPPFENFNLISGPSPSESSSVTIVNGQMSKSVSISYSYVLEAKSVGKFKIPSASISVEGKNITSNEVQIEVVAGNSNKKQTNQNQNQQTASSNEINGDDLFVKTNISKSTLYKGEHLIATIKLYTKLNLVGFEGIKLSDFKGFWVQDLEDNKKQYSIEQENVDGEIFNIVLLKKVLLIPQQGGDIYIEPTEIECVIQQQIKNSRRSFFDDFFGSVQNVKKKVVSPKVKISVKDLPSNSPASFNGAVGSLNMKAEIDKLEAKTNDAITLKVTISGDGNLKLLNEPKIEFPTDFEVYDAKITDKISNNANGSSGSKTFEYLMIPRYAGKFTIPSFEFSYFDVKSGKYVSQNSDDFELNIEKGNEDENSTIVSNFAKEDVKFIGKDIRFIKTDKFDLQNIGSYIYGSTMYVLSFPTLFLAFLIILFLRRKRIRENANMMLVKNRKANKMAQKRLKLANKFLKENNQSAFYDEILKALWGYLSDKLGISLADLSKDNVIETLQKYEFTEIAELSNIIDNCEFARFAPEASGQNMDEMYDATMKMIGKIDNQIKKKIV